LAVERGGVLPASPTDGLASKPLYEKRSTGTGLRGGDAVTGEDISSNVRPSHGAAEAAVAKAGRGA